MTPTELASLEALAKAATPGRQEAVDAIEAAQTAALNADCRTADKDEILGHIDTALGFLSDALTAANPAAILSLIEENKRMREALEPFSVVAGELFASNFNRPDIVFEIEQPNLVRVTAGDFFRARAALEPQS